MTFREFTGKNVEEAIRSAMKEYASDLVDLDIEILAQGSRGILGVGGEDARILAAPKSAVASATSVRARPEPPRPAAPAEERASQPTDTPSAPEPLTQDAGEAVSDAEAHPATPERRERREDGRTRGARGGRGRNGGRERSAGPRPDRPARTEHRDRPEREPAPFIPAKPMEELSDEERATLADAQAVLTELLRLMDVEGSVEVAMGSESAKLNVKGSDLGALIGRRGEKLASLQHIVNLIVAKREGHYTRIAVDVENYRGRREEQLREVAERAAKRVTQTGKIIQLEAMPAVERRIVHMALVDNGKVRTQSVGVEPARRVVILPASRAGD